MGKRVLCFLILLVFLAGCAAPEPARSPDEILPEILESVRVNGPGGRDAADGLVRELKRADRRQGELWEEILDFWEETDGMEILYAPPKGLPEDESLCIAVLGYQLNADGTIQEELEERLRAALLCAERYPKACVLCTGGPTASGDRNATEAGKMGEWLIRQGLDAERLVVEDHSLSTVENALFSCVLLQETRPEVDTVILVSSDYHVPWGALLFEAAFLKSAYLEEGQKIHVASNCACDIDNPYFSGDSVLSWQISGIRQMFRIGYAN